MSAGATSLIAFAGAEDKFNIFNEIRNHFRGGYVFFVFKISLRVINCGIIKKTYKYTLVYEGDVNA